MVHLLDVNLLIALVDRDHTHHLTARSWFAENQGNGWATCPITENGFVRILSNPKYPGKTGSALQIVHLLRALKSNPAHQFWPDTLSIDEYDGFAFNDQTSHKSVTDLYLLGLATSKDGKLATLDRRIDPGQINGGSKALTLIA